VVPDAITVTVTVTIDPLSGVEVGGIDVSVPALSVTVEDADEGLIELGGEEVGVVDVAVPALDVTVEEADEELIELPDPEPVIPPVAPAALMTERAFFSPVQAIVVPFELTDGSAKHCWVAGQLPCEVSNCPFTQEAMAPWTQVVSPLVQGPVTVLFAAS